MGKGGRSEILGSMFDRNITNTHNYDSSFSFSDRLKKFNDEKINIELERFCNILSKEEQENLFEILISKFESEKILEKINVIFNNISKSEKNLIPISIFSTKMSPLESIVFYMKEILEMRFHDIAEKLGKSEATIWLTYRNAKIKKTEKKIDGFENIDYSTTIPLDYFSSKRSILENVVLYLAEILNFKIKDISILLKKSQSTIWTTYNRVREK